MIFGDIISAVRTATGWNVVTCKWTLLGWKAGRGWFVTGDTPRVLFETLRAQHAIIKRLVIGFPRSDFLIRTGTKSTENQFPDAHRFVFWQRPVDQDGSPATETAAMRKDMVESIISLARDAGFSEILIYPSWFGVISGWPRLPEGDLLNVDDGSIRRAKRGWSPWNRTKPVSSPSGTSEYHLNLGGLLLFLSREVPEGWIYPRRLQRTWRILGIPMLIVACIFVWYFSGMLELTGAIAREQMKRDRLIAESSSAPSGCTVDDLIEFFVDHSSAGDSTTYITRFRYSKREGIEFAGRTVSAGKARTFVERFNGDHFSITQSDAEVIFSLSSRLPCDQ